MVLRQGEINIDVFLKMIKTLDAYKIKQIKASMVRGEAIPLVLIEYDGDGDAIVHIDGLHRAKAAKALGVKRIPCLIKN
jgi:ParB-like chromosome segregation protein Spo0J